MPLFKPLESYDLMHRSSMDRRCESSGSWPIASSSSPWKLASRSSSARKLLRAALRQILKQGDPGDTFYIAPRRCMVRIAGVRWRRAS